MRRRRHKLQVSTFPFLAVLLCAMGSLILVLLIMDHRSKQAARARGRQEADRLLAERDERDRERRAEWERKGRALRAAWESRRAAMKGRVDGEEKALDAELTLVRARLQQAASHLLEEKQGVTQLEHDLGEERARVVQREQAVEKARGGVAKSGAVLKAADGARARLSAELTRLERVLRDLKAGREKETHTYSVVPYKGKQGDSRRPLYIECAENGLMFHPDRLAMPPSTSPEEVRAEVLRRLVVQKQTLPSGADPRPYLLVLVRPTGIAAYYGLQGALQDLEIDFGYEFIENDWALDFPADNTPPTRTQPWTPTVKGPPSGVQGVPRERPGVGLGAPTTSLVVGGPTGGNLLPGAAAGPVTGPGGGAPGKGTGAPGTGTPGAGTPGSGTGTPGVAGTPGLGSGAPGAGAQGTGMLGSGSGTSGVAGAPGLGIGIPGAGAPGANDSQSGVSSAVTLARPMPGGTSGGLGAGSEGAEGSTGSDGTPRPLSPALTGPGGLVGVPPMSTSEAGTAIPGGPALLAPVPGAGLAGIPPKAPSGPGMVGLPLSPLNQGTGADTPGLSPPGNGSPGAGAGSPALGGGSGVASAAPRPANPGPGSGAGSGPGTSVDGPIVNEAPRPVGGLPPVREKAAPNSAIPTPALLPGLPGAAPPVASSGSASGSTPTSPPGAGTAQVGSAPAQPGTAAAGNAGPRTDAKAGTPGAPGRGGPGGGTSGGGTPGEGSDDPLAKLAPPAPPAPPIAKRTEPRPLRPARLHGDGDWIIYVECQDDVVILYPSRNKYPVEGLNHSPQYNSFYQAVRAMIARREKSLRPGEKLPRIEVRFLVHPTSLKTYHLAYPALDALPVPKTQQNLHPEDDIHAILAGN